MKLGFRPLLGAGSLCRCKIEMSGSRAIKGSRAAHPPGLWLYDELIRVPLILRGTRIPTRTVRPGLVSSIDIAPTLLSYAGIDVTARMEGRDLLSGDPMLTDAIFAQYESLRYAIRTREWKLIINTQSGSTELYDLSADPQERKNVIARHPNTLRALDLRLREWRNGLPRLSTLDDASDVDITDAEVERLRVLGYVD